MNVATKKDHFPLPFIDQILERVAGHEFYLFLDGYSDYYQIEIDLIIRLASEHVCEHVLRGFSNYHYFFLKVNDLHSS